MASNHFYFDNDAEAKLALASEGKRLKDIAVKLWESYENSYEPSQYIRTKKSKQSIKLGRLKKLDAFTWGIELVFRDDLAYHDSVMGSGHKKGHSIMLISEGWKVKKGKSRNVYRFGYFEGTDYISNIVREFEKGSKKGISIEMNWDGKEFVKGDKHKNVLK